VDSRTYTVTGMTCGHCASSVAEEVGAVPGVAAVEVDLAGGLLRVDAESPDDAAVLAAVTEAGYSAARTP
jgi:copper chaperone